jgi:hypothetical protein
MSGRVGSITTDIIADGLVFNMDAANRASTIPSTNTTTTFNTINLSQSGSFINDTFYDSSTISPSYALDGNGDRIQLIPNDLDFSSFTNGFTMSVWVKLGNNTQTGTYIYSRRNSANNDNIFSILYGYVSQKYELYNGAGGVLRTNSQITVSDTNWHNICYSIGTSAKGYLDASLTTNVSYGSMVVLGSSTGDNIIGDFGNGTNDVYGNIGPFHVYNRPLSSNEVLHNYNALKGRFGL